ncbi:unnamed protein product [Cercospora beticola]|nr:unnamed protein product [Cercospora beticola]
MRREAAAGLWWTIRQAAGNLVSSNWNEVGQCAGCPCGGYDTRWEYEAEDGEGDDQIIPRYAGAWTGGRNLRLARLWCRQLLCQTGLRPCQNGEGGDVVAKDDARFRL